MASSRAAPSPAPESSLGIMVGLAGKQRGEKGVKAGVTPTARMNRFHPRP